MTDEQRIRLKNFNIDLDEVLERFVGNDDLYLKCLKKFLNDESFSKLKDSVFRKDAEAAFNAVHSLKGVSGNLGFDRLFRAAGVITEVFRAGSLDYEKEDADELENAYDEAVSMINSL